jgi:GT2 family glycosyltransferase
MAVTIAITIATHNRRADLERTLAQLANLNPQPDEVLVCADGCTDDTEEFVRDAHPKVRLLTHDTAKGSIPSRNELAHACTADVFVSLDDDSYPLDIDFVSRVRVLFEAEPRLAVAGFAQRSDEFPESLTSNHFGPARFEGSYANSGAAIRVAQFIERGGYPEFFFHAYEEPDFTLRCVSAGWQVRYEPSILIRHHFTTAQRNEIRTHHRHARNEFWSVLLRCPAPQFLAVAIFRAARQFAYACKRGPAWVIREPVWWWKALVGIGKCLEYRAPIPWPIYYAWMQLVRQPIESREEWNALFGGNE